MKIFVGYFLHFFCKIYLVWDIQKCMLEVFLKNLYTVLNAFYLSILKFEPLALLSIKGSGSSKIKAKQNLMNYLI